MENIMTGYWSSFGYFFVPVEKDGIFLELSFQKEPTEEEIRMEIEKMMPAPEQSIVILEAENGTIIE